MSHFDDTQDLAEENVLPRLDGDEDETEEEENEEEEEKDEDEKY